MHIKQEIKFILSLLSKYKSRILANVILSILSFSLYIIIPLIEQKIIDEGLIAMDIRKLSLLLVTSSVLAIIGYFIDYIQVKIQNDISLYIRIELKLTALRHGLRLTMKEIHRHGLLPYIRDSSTDAATISQICSGEVLSLITELFKVIGYLIGLLILNWKLTLVVLLIIPIKLIISNIIGNKREKAMDELLDTTHKITRWESDYISGVNEIKNGNLYKYVEKEYRILINKREQLQKRLSNLMKLDSFLKNTSEKLLTSFLYIIAGIMIINESLTLGVFIAFIAYSTNLFYPIEVLSCLKLILAEVIPSIKSYTQFINKEEENNEGNDYSEPNVSNVSNIMFNNITFSYDDKPIFKDFTFQINKNERTAIIGHNGSGKTTLINLLLRYYYPQEGNIYLEDHDIKEIRLDVYRNLFSVVNQNIFLFNDSVKNNISLFDDKTYLDDNLDGLLEFTSEFTDGLSTRVGFNGSNLSGGQKQRIALARALVKCKSSKILLLDEATSNCDVSIEENFLQLISMCNCDYILMVTHNYNLLPYFERIVVLDKGQIVADGSYMDVENYLKEII